MRTQTSRCGGRTIVSGLATVTRRGVRCLKSRTDGRTTNPGALYEAAVAEYSRGIITRKAGACRRSGHQSLSVADNEVSVLCLYEA